MSERKTGLGSIRALARASAEAAGVDLGSATEMVGTFKGLVNGSGGIGDPIEDFRRFLDGPGWQQKRKAAADPEVIEGSEEQVADKVKRRLHVVRAAMFRASGIDEAKIPKRRLLLGNTALVGTLSLLAGSGGRGKSILQLARAIALASGREVTGERLHEGAKCVLYFNFEDPRNEIQMRAAGICRANGIPLPENLALVSGLDLPFECTIALDEEGSATVNMETVRMLDGLIQEEGVEVLLLDPFVRLHTFSENDNTKIDFVVRQLARMAVRHEIALLLVHHMNKAAAASRAVEGAGRGASSLTDGVRNSEVIHCATADEITALLRDHEQEMLRIAGGNIENRRFVYTHSSKVNYVLPVSGRRWFYLRSVKLLNGDEVGVPVPFTLSAKAAENVVFLLLEVAGHVFDTCGRGSNVHFTLNAAAQWLADRHSKNRSTYHKGLQNLLLGRKELMLSDGTTVRLKDDNQGHAALFFNFDGRDDAL